MEDKIFIQHYLERYKKALLNTDVSETMIAVKTLLLKTQRLSRCVSSLFSNSATRDCIARRPSAHHQITEVTEVATANGILNCKIFCVIFQIIMIFGNFVCGFQSKCSYTAAIE